jgi:hypothetical protein
LEPRMVKNNPALRSLFLSCKCAPAAPSWCTCVELFRVFSNCGSVCASVLLCWCFLGSDISIS